MAGVAPEVPRALAGRYRLVRLLARGGMAEVWEGRDEVLSRPVAVKVLMAHLASDPLLRERFRREAVTAARLVHPGIVAIFDAGVEVLGEEGTEPGSLFAGYWARDENQALEMAWPDQPSTAFIVMELVLGETLRDLIARNGPLPPEVAVAIASQVTEALAYAHAQGLVHRDIKPANVLLGNEGADLVRVKVADFGIAKAAATANLDLTASGTLLGTPKYLAPEQVQGDEPDARADLYSLGVVLYEMLAGRAPFKGPTEMATALAHVQQEPPALDSLRPGLPPALYELVGALLVKDPAQRVPSALVLGGALMSVRRLLGMPAADAGPYIKLRGVATGPGAQVMDSASQTNPSLPLEIPSAAPGEPPHGRTAVLEGPEAATSRLAAGPAGSPAPGGDSGAGAAVGEAPRVGPSRDASTISSQERRRRRRRRTGRAASIVVAVLLLAGTGVLLDLLRTGGHGIDHHTASPGAHTSTPESSGGSTNVSGAIGIVKVQELTEGGNLPNDNLDTLDDVITGKAPAWVSDQYRGPDFGNYGGFGLVLHLDGTHALKELQVQTGMLNWSAQVYVSNAYHAAVGQWGRPVSHGSRLYGSQTFALHGTKGSWVLFWMLNPGGSDQAMVRRLTVT